MGDRKEAVLRAPARPGRPDVVRRLAFAGDDVDLVRGLRRGDPAAPAALFDRYAVRVRRILARVLGTDSELKDVLHETFAEALAGIGGLDDPARLRAWLSSVAVFTARRWIRRRQRQRWLRFFAPEDVPEASARDDHDGREALRRTYRVLERLPADERIAFALHTIDGMELTEAAEACAVSLSTLTRRLVKARKRFEKLAANDPVLRAYLEEAT